MNQLKQLFYHFKQFEYVTIPELEQQLQWSESKIRKLIRSLRDLETENGFKIKTDYKRGFCLLVTDEKRYQSFCGKLEQISGYDANNKEYRKDMILILLLQNSNYISIDRIAEVLDVSRKTVITDLENIKTIVLPEWEVEMVSKSHYGIKLIGEEIVLRRLFDKLISKFSVNSDVQMMITCFPEDEQFTQLQNQFEYLLKQNQIIMTRNAEQSILLYLQILLFRCKQGNKITGIEVNEQKIDKKIHRTAAEICICIENLYHLNLSEDEIDVLAAHIFGKAISEQVPVEMQEQLLRDVHTTLVEIDQIYLTDFGSDELLKESLMLHIYPLVMRISYGLELSNSLMDSLPAQFTNSFLAAIRFIELHPELVGHALSRDEIGYIALHFATHYERQQQQILSNIHSVLFIHQDMRRDTVLVKTKIQSIFPNAHIRLIPKSRMEHYDLQMADFIISTTRLEIDDFYAWVSDIFDDEALISIKNIVGINSRNILNHSFRLESLFYNELFFWEYESGYLEILSKYSYKMEELGFAMTGYRDSLLLREERLNTIYDNGVAVPHSIIPLAVVDSIAVVILKHSVVYEEKLVRCIFLTNIKSGHLFIHQEMSAFVTKLMSITEKVDRVCQSETLEEFLRQAKITKDKNR